jgi:tellurite resistance protein
VSTNIFKQRRQALEDQFYREREAELIEKMRAELATQKTKEQLHACCGIEEDEVLEALINLGVGADDLSALALVPLVQVAWADGNIDLNERDAVLDAANQQGVERGSHSYALLEAWLDKQPKSELYVAWAEYVQSLTQQMETGTVEAMKESVLGLAHDVASAAGGILGIKTISANEKAVLEAVAKAFEG